MADRDHAILAPSASDRWLTCTRSARFELRFQKENSVYADEGSLAHSFCELRLSYTLNQITKEVYKEKSAELKEHDLYNPEMLYYAKHFNDYVMGLYLQRKRSGWAEIFIEDRIDLSSFVPESYGHLDVGIISDDQIDVIDFKYGQGVKVLARANSQLGLYAYGLYAKWKLLDEFKKVNLHIYQPRLDHIDESKDELRFVENWIDGKVKRQGQLAFEGRGDFKPGDHCRFCAGKTQCKALADYNLNHAKSNFKLPDELKDEELASILLNAAQIKNWLTAIQDYALDQTLRYNKNWPGFKLVRGRSNRKIIKEAEFIKAAKRLGFTDSDLIERRLRPIGQLENTIGKDLIHVKLASFIHKPEGLPTLVPADDNRIALNSPEAAKQAFKDIPFVNTKKNKK